MVYFAEVYFTLLYFRDHLKERLMGDVLLTYPHLYIAFFQKL